MDRIRAYPGTSAGRLVCGVGLSEGGSVSTSHVPPTHGFTKALVGEPMTSTSTSRSKQRSVARLLNSALLAALRGDS